MNAKLIFLLIWTVALFGCAAGEPTITPKWTHNPENPADRVLIYAVQDKQQVTHGSFAFKDNYNGTGGVAGNSHATEGSNQTAIKGVASVLNPLSRYYSARDQAPYSVSDVRSQTILEGGDAQAGSQSDSRSTTIHDNEPPQTLYDCLMRDEGC